MPKFFCISDIHSFYEPMIEVLNSAGFDPANPEHILLVLGDCLDRGHDSDKVFDYLNNLKHKILIKGNHEQLLLDCCERGYPDPHDWHNGTAQTIIDLAPDAQTFGQACSVVYDKVKPFIDNMVNYFETEHYIFVHGWTPVNHNNGIIRFSKMDNFREATQQQWDDAMWLCGPDMAMDGYNNTGKTVVFGHWHTSYLWSIKDGRSEFSDDAKFDIFYGDGFIAIDACTAHSKQVNCLVLEDDFI